MKQPEVKPRREWTRMRQGKRLKIMIDEGFRVLPHTAACFMWILSLKYNLTPKFWPSISSVHILRWQLWHQLTQTTQECDYNLGKYSLVVWSSDGGKATTWMQLGWGGPSKLTTKFNHLLTSYVSATNPSVDEVIVWLTKSMVGSLLSRLSWLSWPQCSIWQININFVTLHVSWKEKCFPAIKVLCLEGIVKFTD